ncbi:MAG: hypothetical protein M1831_006088 [Alyxoria varia]|nr:MAG: hypothetical protein M1831_006088 [Alyxoria varia]
MARRSRSGTASSSTQSAYPGPTSSSIWEPQDIPGGFPDSDPPPYVSSQKTLTQAIYARRAEYCRPCAVRIKIGTWNVAGRKGTENDLGEWFVKGKAVSESLTASNSQTFSSEDLTPQGLDGEEARESVGKQELRRTTKKSTVPKHDPGQVPGGEDVGIYALGLQEIVDINSATEALRPYADPTTTKKWRKKVEEALPPGYQLIVDQQMMGLLILVYASPDVASHVSSVSTVNTGTGLWGYMQNKGATATRIVLGETTRIVLINSHLGSGVGKQELERRNWDASQIVSKTKFSPIVDSLGYASERSEKIGDEDFAFWFGDLNYRLEGIPGDDVRRLLMLHTRKEYGTSKRLDNNLDHEISSTTHALNLEHSRDDSQSSIASTAPSTAPSQISSSMDVAESERRPSSTDTLDSLDDEDMEYAADPASLQTTLNSLLPHDELHQQQDARKMFHDGWKEGPITFLPTYKYDVGTVALLDSSEKRRAPSWCDRILYRTRKSKMDYENMLVDEQHAHKKDEDMKAQGMEQAADDESMLFDYDPEADAEDDIDQEYDVESDSQSGKVVTKAGYQDVIMLEHYVSHQRVLSSDHKPLDATFKLEYDAVIPELKAKIHQEVVRDLDRAENEGRPSVTLVVDGNPDAARPDLDGVNFGDVCYGDKIQRSFTIANTGRTNAEFGLVTKPTGGKQEMSPTPSWLFADFQLANESNGPGALHIGLPPKGVDWCQDLSKIYSLEPGSACAVKLILSVQTIELARALNEGQTLDDILVLRVKDGRDHFIPVRGNWKPSVFGEPIHTLVRIPEGGIRAWNPARIKLLHEGFDSEDVVKWSAPREILRLTEILEHCVERLVAEWSMLGPEDESQEDKSTPWNSFAGWPFVEESWTTTEDERRDLRVSLNELLDNGASLEGGLSKQTSGLLKIETLAETFRLFVGSIEDGVITKELWEQLETAFFTKERQKSRPDNDDQRAAILEILACSSHHSVSFIIITAMLGRIAQELATSVQDAASFGNNPDAFPKSPRVPIRRKTLDQDPTIARRQLINKNYAVVFADTLIRNGDAPGKKGKASNPEQKRELIELFLDSSIS